MIDWARVAELQDEVGKDEFAEVVSMFLDEAEEVLARMSSDLGPAALSDECHFLKGAALNLGFSALAAICQTAEQRAKGGNGGTDIVQMRQTYHDSRAALIAGLADLAA